MPVTATPIRKPIRQPARLYSGATPAQVAQDLQPLVTFESEGVSLGDLDRLLQERLAPHLLPYDHPGFQSMFNTGLEPGAHHGAAFALTHNQGVSNWHVSPGGAMLEELCCQALCRLFGLGPEADATFMYSGTYANQEAIYLALHRYAERQGFDLAQQGMRGFAQPEKLTVIVSADAHFSFRHAVRMVGLGEDSLLPLEVTGDRTLDLSALQAALTSDRQVCCVVANAGSTATGAIDPLQPIADLCQAHDTWLHVDGAYGLAYQLVPECQPRFAGLDQADSITWDPHKQMGVPIPNSVLFVRRWQDFGRMAVFSSVFNRQQDTRPNPGLKSPPSTRPMSALPLVTSLRYQGMTQVIERLRSPLLAMQELAAYLRLQPDVEVCHSPHTGVLCLRMVPPTCPTDQLDELQEWLYSCIGTSGERLIATTKLGGTAVLRLVAVSPVVTTAALLETIAALRLLVAQRYPQPQAGD